MSAFMWIFGLMTLMQPVFSKPMPDYIVTEYDVVIPMHHTNTINCSECISFINSVKNETEVLEKVVHEIEQVCSNIYGPAAHECVNVTHDMEKGLAYLVDHNSTQVCKNLHYC